MSDLNVNNSPTELLQHNGTKAYRSKLMDVLRLKFSLVRQGLTGFYITNEEWILLSPELEFNPILDPGEAPAAVQAWNVWKYNKDKYDAQQDALNEFLIKFIASFHINFVNHFSEANFGLRRRSAAQLLAELDSMFGVLTVADITENEGKLSIPSSTMVIHP